MKKTVSAVLLVLAALFLMSAAHAATDMKTACCPAWDPLEHRTITVKGNASVQIAPDIAMVTLSIKESSPGVLTSQEIVNERINAIVTMLKEEGIESKDISTTNMSIQTLKGYTTTCALNIIVRDLDKAGLLIDKALTEGAEELSGIQFTRENYKEVVDQALALAIGDAKRKAGVIAAEGGAELDVMLEAREEASYFTFNRVFADEAAPEIEGGIVLQGGGAALQSGMLYQIMTVVVTFVCK